MTTPSNPELYLSDPLYETSLSAPELKKCSFVYIGFSRDEMTSEQSEADFDDPNNPVFRYVDLSWDYKIGLKKNSSNQEIDELNVGSFSEDQASKVLDAEFFSINKSIQFILEDTQPEERFDPQRYQVDLDDSPSATNIKQDFLSNLRNILDSEDEVDDTALFEAYANSLKSSIDSSSIPGIIDDTLEYLSEARENFNEEINYSEEDVRSQDANPPKTSFKFKISLNNRYAPSLVSSAISSTGPFSSELSDLLPLVKRQKNSVIDNSVSIENFTSDIENEKTKSQIYKSFIEINPALETIIRSLSLLFTGNVIDATDSEPVSGDSQIKDAYEEVLNNFDDTNFSVNSQQTKNVLNQIAKKLGKSIFSNISSVITELVKPVGYRINRKELRPILQERPSTSNSFTFATGFSFTPRSSLAQEKRVQIIQSDPLYVFDARSKSVRDIRIRYGSVYDFSVSTVYEISIPYIGENGQLLINKVLVASEQSNTIRVVAEDFTVLPVVPEVEIERVFDEKAVPKGIRLSWSHPPDIKGKIRGFRVYRRSANLKEPFRLLTEFQFRQPPFSHNIFYDKENSTARSEAPNGVLVNLLKSVGTSLFERYISFGALRRLNLPSQVVPQRYFNDERYTQNRQYIYCVTCVDVHGNESACSDQVTFDFESGQENIVIRGCPLDYPNLYIDRRKLVDSQISSQIERGQTKAVIFFDPVAKTIYDLDYRGQSFKTGRQLDTTPSLAFSDLENNLNTFDATVQKNAGRNSLGLEDGTDAFIFSSEGSVKFGGISAEYDFIILDKENLNTAVIKTNVKYGDEEDREFDSPIAPEFFEE
jgi:hypothetical protein